MPHPLLYEGNQDDDRTRSIDAVHIEPSIREGTVLVSSLYGSDASRPLERFSPTTLDNAYIVGDPTIPSRLVVVVGTWVASPTADFEYQWMANGVDIPGATGVFWDSTIEYDGQEITCEIRGFNYLGEAYTIATGFVISRLEPQEVNDLDYHVITGLNQPNYLNTNDDRMLVVTGRASDTRFDMMSAVTYFTTGLSAEDRVDFNAMRLHAITGLGIPDNQSILNDDAVYVVSFNYVDPLVDSVRVFMGPKNREAELGTLGWVSVGGASYTAEESLGGNWSFHGGENNPETYSYLYQDVPIQDIWEADVDAGLCSFECYWYQRSESTIDMANVRFAFLDQSGTEIGVDSGKGFLASPNDYWFYRDHEGTIPPNTRFIRLVMEFSEQSGNQDHEAWIEYITLFIRKGPKYDSRSLGPDFNQWRIRFTLANTWSGCGLSELEFRNGVGGADLAVGGSPIFGSAGLGVSNADFAFDDVRNNGYWAGAEFSVSAGTSWLGYDMGTPVKPREIDITARLGSDALHMGREFYLEGSNDGINWVPVQHYPQELVPSFSSGQQRQFEVADGPIRMYADDLPNGNYIRQTSSSDDLWTKGMVFRANARLSIDTLSVLLNDTTGVAFNYRMTLCRLDSGVHAGQIGRVRGDPLEKIDVVAPNGGSTFWSNVACENGPHTIEVGEYFLVAFSDLDAGSNPVDANEGRTYQNINPFQSNQETNMTYLKNGVVSVVSVWTGGTTNLVEGSENPTNTSNFGACWAVDFGGTVF